MADPYPRYIVLTQRPDDEQAGRGRPPHRQPTVSRILDRWYCYWAIARFVGHRLPSGRWQESEVEARAVCASLNAEHDAWLVDE